jgi:hypothetical protein
VVRTLFSFRPRARGGGRFEAEGILPGALEVLGSRGVFLDDDLFEAGVDR